MAWYQAAVAHGSCNEMLSHSSCNGQKNYKKTPSTATWSHTLKLKSFDLLMHWNNNRKGSAAPLTTDPLWDVRPYVKIVLSSFISCSTWKHNVFTHMQATWHYSLSAIQVKWSGYKQFNTLLSKSSRCDRIQAYIYKAEGASSMIDPQHSRRRHFLLLSFSSSLSCQMVYNQDLWLHPDLWLPSLCLSTNPLNLCLPLILIPASMIFFPALCFPCPFCLWPGRDRGQGCGIVEGGACHVVMSEMELLQ